MQEKSLSALHGRLIIWNFCLYGEEDSRLKNDALHKIHLDVASAIDDGLKLHLSDCFQCSFSKAQVWSILRQNLGSLDAAVETNQKPDAHGHNSVETKIASRTWIFRGLFMLDFVGDST